MIHDLDTLKLSKHVLNSLSFRSLTTKQQFDEAFSSLMFSLDDCERLCLLDFFQELNRILKAITGQTYKRKKKKKLALSKSIGIQLDLEMQFKPVEWLIRTQNYQISDQNKSALFKFIIWLAKKYYPIAID